jgi:hypothetical protein
MNDRNFDEVVEKSKKAARAAFRLVAGNVLGTHIATNYGQLRKCFKQKE